MNHLETSDADSAQSKDVWNENLELLMSLADCLLSADCLLVQILFLAAGHLENSPLVVNYPGERMYFTDSTFAELAEQQQQHPNHPYSTTDLDFLD